MTAKEFSDEFDTLLSQSAANGAAVSIDEYEKSVLLTLAQEEIVKGLYSGRLSGESFEQTEEVRRGLDSLIKTISPSLITGTGIDSHSKLYQLDADVWYIVYESVELGDAYCENNSTVEVIPVRQDEWHKIKNNPFKGPNRRRVIRIDCGKDKVELISTGPIKNYLVRYISKPSPIILTTLEGNLKIDGEQQISTCKLNQALHRLILEKAVELAAKKLAVSQ